MVVKKKLKQKVKARPNRVYLDSRGKYYILVNGVKRYLKTGHPDIKNQNINKLKQNQIVKVVVNNPGYYRKIKLKKRKRKSGQDRLHSKNILFGDNILNKNNMSMLPVGYNFDQGQLQNLSNKISGFETALSTIFDNKLNRYPEVADMSTQFDSPEIKKEKADAQTQFDAPEIKKEKINSETQTDAKIKTKKEKADAETQFKIPKPEIPVPDFKNTIFTYKELNTKTNSELRLIANDKGVKKYYNKNKSDLIQMILENQNPTTQSDISKNKNKQKDINKEILQKFTPITTKTNEDKEFTNNLNKLNDAIQNDLIKETSPPLKPPSEQSNNEFLQSNLNARRAMLAEDDDNYDNYLTTDDEVDEVDDRPSFNPAKYSGFGYGFGFKNHDGLYDNEIHDIIKDKTRRFVPVICADQIPLLTQYIKKPKGRFVYVMNTSNYGKPGKHWIAVCIDWDRAELCYYDSLADLPNRKMLHDLNKLIIKYSPETYFKLKTNKIKDQSNKTANCGWFCANFIIKMLKGASFAKASNFSGNINKSEKQIERFKKSFI